MQEKVEDDADQEKEEELIVICNENNQEEQEFKDSYAYVEDGETQEGRNNSNGRKGGNGDFQ